MTVGNVKCTRVFKPCDWSLLLTWTPCLVIVITVAASPHIEYCHAALRHVYDCSWIPCSTRYGSEAKPRDHIECERWKAMNQPFQCMLHTGNYLISVNFFDLRCKPCNNTNLIELLSGFISVLDILWRNKARFLVLSNLLLFRVIWCMQCTRNNNLFGILWF